MLKQKDIVRDGEPMTIQLKRAFLNLPLAERRTILLQQAKSAATHYETEQSAHEREEWQGGDIVEQ